MRVHLTRILSALKNLQASHEPLLRKVQANVFHGNSLVCPRIPTQCCRCRQKGTAHRVPLIRWFLLSLARHRPYTAPSDKTADPGAASCPRRQRCVRRLRQFSDYVEHCEGPREIGKLSAEPVVREYEAAATEFEGGRSRLTRQPAVSHTPPAAFFTEVGSQRVYPPGPAPLARLGRLEAWLTSFR
jgi:hypothetical protein